MEKKLHEKAQESDAAARLYTLCDRPLTETCDLIYGKSQYTFRIGRTSDLDTKRPLFETRCDYVTATVSDVIAWSEGQKCGNDVLCSFDPGRHFAYLDYKHVKELSEPDEKFLKVVDWSCCGLRGRGPAESTVWFGTPGAHTPLHSDTYGYNVVFQVRGRKKWVLFPWGSYTGLHPTRVPYEESSIYSDVNLFGRDVASEPELFKDLQPRAVVLEPGDMLMVPAKWWHYVESLDLSLSINTWVELASDDQERFKESIVRSVVNLIVPELELEETNELLNPNEMGILSQPLGSALHCLEQSLSRLESSRKKKDSLPSLLLRKGKPVPLVFAEPLEGEVRNAVERKRRRTVDIDGQPGELADNPDCDLPLILRRTQSDLFNIACKSDTALVESDGTEKLSDGAESAQLNKVVDKDTDDRKKSTSLLFVRALTDPDVVDLISKKIIEFNKDL